MCLLTLVCVVGSVCGRNEYVFFYVAEALAAHKKQVQQQLSGTPFKAQCSGNSS